MTPTPRHTFAACFAALLISPAAFAQSPHRVTVPLSIPGAPVTVEVDLIHGGISVETHANTSEVIVEVQQHALKTVKKPKAPRADGLKRLPNQTSGFEIEEEDNYIEVDSESWHQASGMDVKLIVPVATSVLLETINAGDIVVRGVRGDHEISNVNGQIAAYDVGGSMVAEVVNGTITATFAEVDPKKSMGFSSVNGTIDVTFPANLGAKLVMSTEFGEILTGFDIDLSNREPEIERHDSGGFSISVNRDTRGTVGGGGPEYRFENHQGDIIIRKAGG